jgi:hypothetical protein
MVSGGDDADAGGDDLHTALVDAADDDLPHAHDDADVRAADGIADSSWSSTASLPAAAADSLAARSEVGGGTRGEPCTVYRVPCKPYTYNP